MRCTLWVLWKKRLFIMEAQWISTTPQIEKFMGPTWGPPGSCRHQMGPMLAPRILLLWTKYNNNSTSYFCCLIHFAQWTLNQALSLRNWVTICSSISRHQVKWAQTLPATEIKLIYLFALTTTLDLARCKCEKETMYFLPCSLTQVN